MTDQYRLDETDSVYEYETNSHAYLFIGNLNGLTLEEFIIQYETQIGYEEES